MNKSILFFILLFFLSSGFVEYDKPVIEDGGQQREFLEFLSHFEKVSLPYSLDLDDYHKKHFSRSAILNKNQSLLEVKVNKEFTKFADKFIPSAIHAKFSRMGRSIIQPMARYYPDDQTVAIIYMSRLQFRGGHSADYKIAYYDLKGNLLGRSKKKRIGANDISIGYANLNQVQTFTIFPSGRIKMTTYGSHWRAKLGSLSYGQNELLGFKIEKTTEYEFSRTNGFQELTQVVSTARP